MRSPGRIWKQCDLVCAAALRGVGAWRWRNSPFCCCVSLPCAANPPHFFGPAQRNGVEPQRKTLMGWWRPREVSGPTRLSHSRGRCHSAAKVSASRTDWITRPRGEGLGSDVDWRLKVFCPAFLQKSGRGPGAEPWPRAKNAPGLRGPGYVNTIYK